MKKSFVLILLLITIPGFNCNETNTSGTENITIEKLIREYSSVFDTKDFHKFSDYCADNMKFFTLDGQVFNKETMVPFLSRMVKQWQNMSTSIEELEIETGNVLGWARYKQVIHYSASGKDGTMNNLISIGLLKDLQTWKIGHFHMSTSYSKSR